jgi:hypothetical protein
MTTNPRWVKEKEKRKWIPHVKSLLFIFFFLSIVFFFFLRSGFVVIVWSKALLLLLFFFSSLSYNDIFLYICARFDYDRRISCSLLFCIHSTIKEKKKERIRARNWEYVLFRHCDVQLNYKRLSWKTWLKQKRTKEKKESISYLRKSGEREKVKKKKVKTQKDKLFFKRISVYDSSKKKQLYADFPDEWNELIAR